MKKEKTMKKNQLLTAFALLGFAQTMVASTPTTAAGSISVTNKSNTYISVTINYDDKNNNKTSSAILAPGAAAGTIKIDSGKTIKNVVVNYYTGQKGNTALDKASIIIAAPANWPTSLFVYGDANTAAGVLTSGATGAYPTTTLPANSLSRFVAYWTGSATAKDEVAGKQPVDMYTLSTDGLFTTLAAF